MLPKNIHYGIFYYSSLQLAAYTAYNIPAENPKSYGQAPNLTSFLNLDSSFLNLDLTFLWARGVAVMTLPYHRGGVAI